GWVAATSAQKCRFCSTVSARASADSWPRYPTLDLTAAPSATGEPSTVQVPPSAGMMPHRVRISVVLPEPFRPRSAVTPDWSENSSGPSTGMSPYPATRSVALAVAVVLIGAPPVHAVLLGSVACLSIRRRLEASTPW